jgi:homoserine kinase type II
MAVYTQVSAEAMQAFLGDYDLGPLLSAKGIAEGVSNSNFLVETATGRFVLTLYEQRTDTRDLPFFIALMEHMADAGLPVPRPIRDRSGAVLKALQGRAACLVQYLPGVSLSRPTPAQTGAAAAALAALHRAGESFAMQRTNSLGQGWWVDTARALGPALDTIEPGLEAQVSAAVERIARDWPTDLPSGIVHADLFPDNVLMLGCKVTGLIDFYFACNDLLAYDLAVLHAAWTFGEDGAHPSPAHEAALFEGYASVRPLSAVERAAFPLLGMGASLRFLLSRAQDWLAPAAGAIMTLKDPLPYARRLRHYGG